MKIITLARLIKWATDTRINWQLIGNVASSTGIALSVFGVGELGYYVALAMGKVDSRGLLLVGSAIGALTWNAFLYFMVYRPMIKLGRMVMERMEKQDKDLEGAQRTILMLAKELHQRDTGSSNEDGEEWKKGE